MGWPGAVTHRQFMAWEQWFDMEWDRPTRADCYAMQTAAEVRRVLSRNPRAIKASDFKLTFERPKAAKKMTRKEAAEVAKERSLARMTTGVVRVLVDKEGNVLSVTKPGDPGYPGQ